MNIFREDKWQVIHIVHRFIHRKNRKNLLQYQGLQEICRFLGKTCGFCGKTYQLTEQQEKPAEQISELKLGGKDPFLCVRPIRPLPVGFHLQAQVLRKCPIQIQLLTLRCLCQIAKIQFPDRAGLVKAAG